MVSSLQKLISLVYQSRNRQLSQFSIFYELEDWWNQHRQVIAENWHFYSGLHQFFFTKYDAESLDDFAKRIDGATIENHVAHIVDLLVSHLYGDPTKIVRYVRRREETDKALMDFFKYSVWPHTGQALLDDNKALTTLVAGYSVIQREFVDLRTGEPFGVNSDPKDFKKYGIIKKRLLDPADCLPLPYINENGFIDPTRLGAVVFIAEYDNLRGNKEVMKALGQEFKKTYVMEYVDDDVWLKWKRNSPDEDWKQVAVNPNITKWTNKNFYEDVRIPFTVYRNTGDPFYLEGDSEVTKLKSMNMELNELAVGDKDTLIYHQYPVLMGLNGAKFPSGFRRTKNATVELDGKDQKFEYLTWEGTLQESQARQDILRRAMSYVSGVSLISRGFLKDIGQIRSGPPLKALFTSERSVMLRKFTAFRASELEEMRADIKMYEKHTKISLDVDKEVTFHVEFDVDFLSIDELLKEEIKALKAQAGTDDIREIIQSRHPDWTEDDIEEALEFMKTHIEQKKIGRKVKSADSKALEQDIGE